MVLYWWHFGQPQLFFKILRIREKSFQNLINFIRVTHCGTVFELLSALFFTPKKFEPLQSKVFSFQSISVDYLNKKFLLKTLNTKNKPFRSSEVCWKQMIR